MSSKKIIVIVTAFLLNACGYHMRGTTDLPINLKSVFVEGGSAPLRDQFKQILKSSSGQLADSRKDVGIVIKVSNENFNRRVLSLSSRGKSNEFELEYRLDYEFTNANDAPLMERQTVNVRREYYNDQQYMIDKDNEEATILNEMYQQAVQTMINRARIVLAAKAK